MVRSLKVVTSLSFPDRKRLFSIQLLVNLWGAKGERYGHPMKAVVNKRDPGTTKLDSINCFRVNTTQNKLFIALRNTQYYPNSKIYKISCFRVLPNPRARISIPFARRPQQVLNRLSLLPPSTNLLRSLLLSCNDKIFLLTNNGRP